MDFNVSRLRPSIWHWLLGRKLISVAQHCSMDKFKFIHSQCLRMQLNLASRKKVRVKVTQARKRQMDSRLEREPLSRTQSEQVRFVCLCFDFELSCCRDISMQEQRLNLLVHKKTIKTNANSTTQISDLLVFLFEDLKLHTNIEIWKLWKLFQFFMLKCPRRASNRRCKHVK